MRVKCYWPCNLWHQTLVDRESFNSWSSLENLYRLDQCFFFYYELLSCLYFIVNLHILSYWRLSMPLHWIAKRRRWVGSSLPLYLSCFSFHNFWHLLVSLFGSNQISESIKHEEALSIFQEEVRKNIDFHHFMFFFRTTGIKQFQWNENFSVSIPWNNVSTWIIFLEFILFFYDDSHQSLWQHG